MCPTLCLFSHQSVEGGQSDNIFRGVPQLWPWGFWLRPGLELAGAASGTPKTDFSSSILRPCQEVTNDPPGFLRLLAATPNSAHDTSRSVLTKFRVRAGGAEGNQMHFGIDSENVYVW